MSLLLSTFAQSLQNTFLRKSIFVVLAIRDQVLSKLINLFSRLPFTAHFSIYFQQVIQHT